MNKKIVIAGTGRAGTTMLINLFTHLGIPTGFTEEECEAVKKINGHGGLEIDFDTLGAEVIKSPYLSLELKDKAPRIQHVIIPIRDLTNSARSRARLKDKAGGFFGGVGTVEAQEYFNAKLIYNMMYDLSLLEIPFTLLPYPDLIYKRSILWERLCWLFKQYNIGVKKYAATFHYVVKPELVSNFKEEDDLNG